MKLPGSIIKNYGVAAWTAYFMHLSSALWRPLVSVCLALRCRLNDNVDYHQWSVQFTTAYSCLWRHSDVRWQRGTANFVALLSDGDALGDWNYYLKILVHLEWMLVELLGRQLAETSRRVWDKRNCLVTLIILDVISVRTLLTVTVHDGYFLTKLPVANRYIFGRFVTRQTVGNYANKCVCYLWVLFVFVCFRSCKVCAVIGLERAFFMSARSPTNVVTMTNVSWLLLVTVVLWTTTGESAAFGGKRVFCEIFGEIYTRLRPSGPCAVHQWSVVWFLWLAVTCFVTCFLARGEV